MNWGNGAAEALLPPPHGSLVGIEKEGVELNIWV